MSAEQIENMLGEHLLRPPTMADPYYQCCSAWGVAWQGTTSRERVEAAHRAHLAAVLAPLLDTAREEALRDAADAWQMNTWADVITPALKTKGIPALAVGQAVTDWLRDRADTAARVDQAGGAA